VLTPSVGIADNIMSVKTLWLK